MQAVRNLHSSGLLPDVIAMQLDLSREDVIAVISHDKDVQYLRESGSIKDAPILPSSLLGMFYLDAVVNIDNIIKSAQVGMWKSLKGGMEFNLSTAESQSILGTKLNSKTTFVILYTDIVGSTRLAMNLPAARLAAIIRAFTHEMSLIVSAYGGYVLKYLGDAILAFFLVPENKPDLCYMPCVNAVQCARAMIRAVREGFNPILLQEDYPDLSVRVGIDVGEVVVVQYGWNAHTSIGNINEEQEASKTPLYDILGYTISMASKITGVAQPNEVVIGKFVFDALDKQQRFGFKLLDIPSDKWSYEGSKTGDVYRLYAQSSPK
jgi:class 3 adenylate cyclase